MSGSGPAQCVRVPHSKSDSLSDFFSGLRFIINAFGHQHGTLTADAPSRVIGDLELIYFRGGTCRITLAGQELECHRGDLVIISPFTVHEIRTVPDDPHENYWIHFDVLPLYGRERLIELLVSDRNHRVSLPTEGTAAKACELMGLAMRNENSSGVHAALEGYLRAICVELVHVKDSGPVDHKDVPRDEARTVLDRAIAYIESHLPDHISVDHLVESAVCSRTTLFTLFNRHFGRSPMAVIRWMRLRHAERLLRGTTLSVKQISAAVGIGSPAHLSRLIKELYGVSPRELRTSRQEVCTP
jgi:AraC-like DNA-binding protein